jgi:acyl carrier protein
MKVELGRESGSNDKCALDRICGLISRVCLINPSDVHKDAFLLAFGIDSVRVIELMLCLEEEFQIHLEPAELSEIVTVGQLAGYIENLCASRQEQQVRMDPSSALERSKQELPGRRDGTPKGV